MKKIYVVHRSDLGYDDWILKHLRGSCQIVLLPEEAEEIVAIGGDGTLNHAVRQYHGLNKPFIGWHRGNRYSQGFLLNPPTKEYLEEYISNQIAVNNIPMLKIELFDGKEVNLGVRYGFGDCYFKGAQGSGFMHARVIIDGEIWFDQLDGDGVLVCTAAGSTAYNASNYGPIETLDFEDLIVNAICPTLWCNWRPRILDRSQTVTLETLHTERRAVNLWIDGHFIDLPVQKIKVSQAKKTVALCFVKSYNFREKVEKLKLQRTKEV